MTRPRDMLEFFHRSAPERAPDASSSPELEPTTRMLVLRRSQADDAERHVLLAVADQGLRELRDVEERVVEVADEQDAEPGHVVSHQDLARGLQPA